MFLQETLESELRTDRALKIIEVGAEKESETAFFCRRFSDETQGVLNTFKPRTLPDTDLELIEGDITHTETQALLTQALQGKPDIVVGTRVFDITIEDYMHMGEDPDLREEILASSRQHRDSIFAKYPTPKSLIGLSKRLVSAAHNILRPEGKLIIFNDSRNRTPMITRDLFSQIEEVPVSYYGKENTIFVAQK